MSQTIVFNTIPFSVKSVSQINDSTLLISFTNNPLVQNPVNTNDGLNVNNYILSGPEINYVISVDTISTDPKSLLLNLKTPLITGDWTLSVVNIQDVDLLDLSNPKQFTFPVVYLNQQANLAQGAQNHQSADVISEHITPMFSGKGWEALISAIAKGDEYVDKLAQQVYDQLFLSSASGDYLTSKASDNGFEKPKGVGISDDIFRELAIKVSAEKVTLQSFLQILKIYYGEDAIKASIDSGSEETYNLNDGDNLIIKVDGVEVNVIFKESDSAVLNNTKAKEAASAITRTFENYKINAYARPVFNPTTSKNFIRIYSGALGLKGKVSVSGGTANNVLGFPLNKTFTINSKQRLASATQPGTDTLCDVILPATTQIVTRKEGTGAYISSNDKISVLNPVHTSSLSRLTDVVTVTTTSPHNLITGDTFFFGPGNNNFPAGVKTVSEVVSSTVFKYDEVGFGINENLDSYICPNYRKDGAVNLKTSVPHGILTGQEIITDNLHSFLGAQTSISVTDLGSLPSDLTTKSDAGTALLPDGRVLIVGGGSDPTTNNKIYTFNPDDNTFTYQGELGYNYVQGTTTTLPNGQVLITGGNATNTPIAKIFDPVNNVILDTSAPSVNRSQATATLLQNDKVMVIAGQTSGSSGGLSMTTQTAPTVNTYNMIQVQQRIVDSTNQYAGNTLFINSDAAFVVHQDGTITTVTPPAGTYDRYSGVGTTIDGYTALLVLKGATDDDYNAYFFDWATETFSATTKPPARTPFDGDGVYSCCLMAGSQVLVVYGPFDSTTSSTPCYVFDATTETWSATGSYPGPYSNSWSPLVQLDDLDILDPGLGHDTGSTRYNQSSGMWTLLASGPANLWSYYSDVNIGLIKLLSGKVALCVSVGYISIFDPLTNTWTDQPLWDQGIYYNETWIVEYEPDKLFIHGSVAGEGLIALYDIATQTWTDLTFAPSANFPFLPYGGYRNTGKWFGINTESTHGQAQVEFSESASSELLQTTELYDPATSTWTNGPSLYQPRKLHTATLLKNGTVLVVGGATGTIPTPSELYNPTNNTWHTIADVPTYRSDHTATLLDNDKVMIVGGIGSDLTVINNTEIYSDSSESWTPGGINGEIGASMSNHTAVKLPNGDVLLLGGNDGSAAISDNVWIYNSALDRWKKPGYTIWPRSHLSSVLLPNGSVYISPGNNIINELYNNDQNVFSSGNLTGIFKATSLNEHSLSYNTENQEIAAIEPVDSSIGSILTFKANDKNYIGPYIFEPNSSAPAITSVKSTLNQQINEGQKYSVLNLTDTSGFNPNGGYLIIDFGYATQTGPIKFYSVLSSTQLSIDSSFKFPDKIEPGVSVIQLKQLGSFSPTNPETIGCFYLTDSSSGRIAASHTIDNAAAVGIKIQKTVTYPNTIGLGNGDIPVDSSGPKLNDAIYIWGSEEDIKNKRGS